MSDVIYASPLFGKRSEESDFLPVAHTIPNLSGTTTWLRFLLNPDAPTNLIPYLCLKTRKLVWFQSTPESQQPANFLEEFEFEQGKLICQWPENEADWPLLVLQATFGFVLQKNHLLIRNFHFQIASKNLEINKH